MIKTLLAAALLVSVAVPALADEPSESDGYCPAHCVLPQVKELTAEQKRQGDINPTFVLTEQERGCLLTAAQKDAMVGAGYQIDVRGPARELLRADPITYCHVAVQHVPYAMDLLMQVYQSNHTQAATWVQSSCHAEPAIPRAKWVCIGPTLDVTRIYR